MRSFETRPVGASRGSALRLVLAAAAAVSLAASGPVAAASPTHRGLAELTPDATVAGQLEGMQARHLSLSLRTGQLVRVSLEQDGEHARLRVFGPSGDRIAETDGSLGFRLDRVELSFIAQRDGDYRLEVTPLLPQAPPLAYRLRLEVLRPSERSDGALIAAERAFVAGVRLRRVPDPTHLKRARELLRQALAEWLEAERPEAVAASRTQLGVVESHLRPSEGVALCKQALREWRQLELPAGRATALDCLGDGQIRRWDLEPARRAYEELLTYATASRRPGIQARALEQLGWIEVFTGDPGTAVATLERSVAIQRRRGDSWGTARALIRLGAGLSRAGRNQVGLDRFRDAIDLAQEIDAQHLILLALGGTGRIYFALGDFEQALASQRRRLDLARELKRRDQEANTLLTLGVIHAHHEQYEEARDAYEQVLRVVEEHENRWAETTAHTNLGAVLQQLGRYGEAVSHLRTAIELARQMPDRETEARALVELGSTRLAIGEIEHGRQLLTRGHSLSRDIGALDQEMQAAYSLARLERDQGDLAAASKLLDSATALAESRRARVAMDALRVTLLARTRVLYELQIAVLLELHETDPQAGHGARAFATAERIKSRTLFELVTLDPAVLEARLAPDVRRRKLAAERRLTRLQRDYMRAASGAQRPKAELGELRTELQAAESELAEIHAHLRRLDPELAEWLDPQPLGFHEARQHLPPGSAMLSYVLGEQGSYLFVLVDGALTTHHLPPVSELQTLVEATHSALERPGTLRLRQYVERAQTLYQVLIAPAERQLDGAERLLISPDGALHHLPFEALLTDEGRGTDVAGLPYLLRRWTVNYIPSASVLAALEHRRSPARAGSHPVAGSPELVAFAAPSSSREMPSPTPPRPASSTMRSVIGEKEIWKLPPLPSAFDEIERITRSVGPARTRAFIGSEATEERVKTSPELASARWIHFATHGLLNELHPLYSGLVLSLDDTAGEDGLLQVYEILDLSLNAEVVVLSACETARGKQVRGEGILGLSRAFFSAGAGSLVVSLWQVADESTAELMASFYTHLAAGRHGPTALRQAKLELLADSRFAHPFYWAPFVLVGRAAP